MCDNRILTRQLAMASLCKVGLNWDSPRAPRVYSQSKLVNNDFEYAKRSARGFNQDFSLENTEVRIANFASNASTNHSSSHTSLKVFDTSLNTRLEGRAAALLIKMTHK